jgi:hypothetical protein
LLKGVEAMAKLNQEHLSSAIDESLFLAYHTSSGHPSIEQLMAEQGTSPIADASLLHGDFWPEEESIEVFLETLHEWRGHNHTESTR